MIALIRKNLRLWGYGKSLALFTGCILFSISGRLNGGIAYERHILSAVSDHYYLTYFVLPIVLLSCFSFIDDDGEPVILRFQSYHSYFLKKWIGVGLIAVILTAVQTGAINYYAVKGGFASDEQISISGNSPELGDVGYPIYAEVAVWAENSYIGKCFLDCQFTGARSKHITDAKRVSSSGSTETWELTVTFASDGFTGYTASVSVDTAKSAVTQIVIRTTNYTLTMTPA